MRRRMGAAALEMDAASDGSWQAQWRATVAARLPSQSWPQRTVLITAVDAYTGEPVVFDRHSGVRPGGRRRRQLCQWPSYRSGQPVHRWRLPKKRECRSGSRIRAGAGAVTIRRQNTATAGLGHATRGAGRRTTRTRQQSRNDLPDSNSEHMFGTNAMDLSLRPPAARAGYDQGRALPGSSPNSGADAHERVVEHRERRGAGRGQGRFQDGFLAIPQ